MAGLVDSIDRSDGQREQAFGPITARMCGSSQGKEVRKL